MFGPVTAGPPTRSELPHTTYVGNVVQRILTAVVVSLVVIAGVWLPAAGALAAEPPAGVDLVVFYGEGCPYCAAELEFLDKLGRDEPTLHVVAYEVWNSDANRAVFRAFAADLGFEASSVPTTILGDRVWVGFDPTIASEIERAVAVAASPGKPTSPAVADEDAVVVDVPFLGPVDVGDRSLIVATLAIGLVDGVNPCSLWVLAMLLALVLHGGSRARVSLVGGVFLTVSALLYGLYIVGFYSALSYMGAASWIRWTVALVVATLGVVQLRDAMQPGHGPSLSIPRDRRPGLYRRMRALAVSDRGLASVVGATAALAVGVSLLETPCTAGLPVLWTGMVADRDVGAAGFAFLFALYLSVFLLDELLLFGAAVVTMRATKLQERHGRELKLLSGLVMVTLAGVLVVRPALLESVGGALVVFASIVIVVAAALAVRRWADVHRSHAVAGK
jgi:cytochrome c biogenesis protein CcdA/glutaredoxin